MIVSFLIVITALTGAPDDSSDWALVNTLAVEHERNAALAVDCAFAFKESRKQIFFNQGVKTNAEVEAVVEVARSGEDLLVKRTEKANVLRSDNSAYTLRLDMVKNAEYIACFTGPETHIELFYHDRPGPPSDPGRGPRAIPQALGVGPHKCGFGDGHSPLSGILEAAREASSEVSCKPVQEGERLYALEITRPSGVFSRIVVDASKGALIVSAVKMYNGQKQSELEVVPAKYEDCWFPKTWKRTTYDKTGKEDIVSSAELTSFSKDTSSIEFTYEGILPSEDMLFAVYDESGQIVQMYSVDGVLVTEELAGIMRRDKKAILQSGG